MGKWGTGKIEKSCAQCNIKFNARHDRPGKFCSRVCVGKSIKQKSFLFSYQCIQCGKEKSAKRYRRKTAKYCSIKCMSIIRGKSMQKEKHPNWKDGISKRPYKSRQAVNLAKKIKKFCERCGSTENLQGHHKIKYSMRPDLCADLNNIEVLCSKCHSMEHPELECMISIPPILKGSWINCVICDKQYYVPRYKKHTSKCCSHSCNSKRTLEIRYGKRSMDQ